MRNLSAFILMVAGCSTPEPGATSDGLYVCPRDCQPAPNPEADCESELIASWQANMPSLGFAGSKAAQAIDAALRTQLDQPGINHTQFTGGRWPGMTVAISQGTKLVFAKSYGFADMQAPQFTHPDDLFRLASDSKQLTGVTILKLIQNGQSVDGNPANKLTLQSKIFQILSSPPNAILPQGGVLNPALMNITVEDVLHHTAGWAYNIGDPVWYAYSIPGAVFPITEDECVSYMMSQAPTLALAGVTFSYSNFGYNLLARFITKITGQDYETIVKQQVLAPLGITRTRVGASLLSGRADGEVRYYAAPNSAPVKSLFPASTGPTLSGDQNLPYGSWSLEAGRGAGGWIASSLDTLRFQLGVNGRGPTQVYPNIFNDIISAVDQPFWSFDGTSISARDPNYTRYNAGWGVNWWGDPFDGWEIAHGGGVNGGGSFTESVPDAPTVQDYGIAILINTTADSGTNVDVNGPVRNAMLQTLADNNDSLLNTNWSADTNFFDQFGTFSGYGSAATTSSTITAAASGCVYDGQSYPSCYPSRLEGASSTAYRAQIVPLHSGDQSSYVLGKTCSSYVSTHSSLLAAGYQQVNLQWYRDSNGTMRFQSVWVKINH